MFEGTKNLGDTQEKKLISLKLINLTRFLLLILPYHLWVHDGFISSHHNELTMWLLYDSYTLLILCLSLRSGNGVITGMISMNYEWWVINIIRVFRVFEEVWNTRKTRKTQQSIFSKQKRGFDCEWLMILLSISTDIF
jgi:hypothetical protein